MPTTGELLTIALLIITVMVLSIFSYVLSRLARLKRSVENNWEELMRCLAQRAGVIPRLVEIVRGYASFERTALDSIIEARNAAMVARTPSDKALAEAVVMRALRSVLVLADAYPDMKANYAFMSARTQLGDLDRELPRVTQSYNDAVDTYNERVTGRRSKTLARLMNYRVYGRYQVLHEVSA